MRYLMFIVMAVVLTACAGGQRITDFEKRSIYYTWVDARAVAGNKMTGFQIRNLSVPKDERYYQMGWEKLGSGYLVWHYGVKPGRYEFDKMWMMSCAGPLCTNTVNEYNFGQLGSGVGSTRVAKPGQVVFGGCHAFKSVKNGLFGPRQFETRKAACGASKAQMMSILMKHAEEPVLEQRIAKSR